MSQKREKRRRRVLRYWYQKDYEGWLRNEPPKWRILSRWRWKKRRPVKPKGVR